jgi:hypothetical protein
MEFAGDRSCRANAEEEVRSDTPPNNLNPAMCGVLFYRIALIGPARSPALA